MYVRGFVVASVCMRWIYSSGSREERVEGVEGRNNCRERRREVHEEMSEELPSVLRR